MRIFFICALSVFALFSSCSQQQQGIDPTGSPPLVVVSIPPYKQFVSRIAGDTVNVISAVPDQYDPHVYEVTPGKINELSSASLWIGVHEQFEEKIIPIIQKANTSFRYVDLTKKVPLLRFSQDTEQLTTHEDDHGHHHHHEGCCSAEGFDRHIWMSPKLALVQAKVIKDALSRMLPEFALEFERNFQQFIGELTDLNKELAHSLEPLRGSAVLVSHASLGYFCNDFGLRQLALETDGKALLPHQLQKIETIVKRNGLQCMYIMPQFEDKGASEIAKQLHLNVVQIDPLAHNYIDNMRYIASMIVGCKLQSDAPTHSL